MIVIKIPEEIEILREGGKQLAEILEKVKEKVAPGVTTKELDRLAESLIFSVGGKPAFKGYRLAGNAKKTSPYPAVLCTSINDEVVHGIPSDRVVKEGDIIGLDIGMAYKGLITDMAATVGVGKIDEPKQRLLNVTKEALVRGIAQIKEGAFVHDIGAAIQPYVESEGFKLVSRELGGHGVGYTLHEEPLISNWHEHASRKIELKAGMVLAIEPMVAGIPGIKLDSDGWTYRTADGSPAAHFEHTIVVTKTGVEILTKTSAGILTE